MTNENNQEEKWEFGSFEWCQFAAETGVRLIEEANLDLSQYEWAFSEEYTHAPERLLGGREKAGYQFMIKDGKISGSAVLTEECLAIPGFHATIEWAMIAHPSAVIYGREGQQQRSVDATKLSKDLEAAGRKSEKGIMSNPSDPLFPAALGAALGKDGEKGGGLHNLTAYKLKRSPELEGMPETPVTLVPDFARMTDEQKERFIKLIGG